MIYGILPLVDCKYWLTQLTLKPLKNVDSFLIVVQEVHDIMNLQFDT